MIISHFHLTFNVSFPERPVPAQFFAFAVIAMILGGIVFLALILFLCTCSTQSFRMDIWDWNIKSKAYEKYALENAAEIAEKIARKRADKIEGLLSAPGTVPGTAAGTAPGTALHSPCTQLTPLHSA